MTVAALRQCLFDPDTRVRPVRYPDVQYPTIAKMEITGGFFDGVELKLHPGLNTILGGKGVGKSLLVEFLRFALDQPSRCQCYRRRLRSQTVSETGCWWNRKGRLSNAIRKYLQYNSAL